MCNQAGALKGLHRPMDPIFGQHCSRDAGANIRGTRLPRLQNAIRSSGTLAHGLSLPKTCSLEMSLNMTKAAKISSTTKAA